YATKSTEVTGHNSRRLDLDSVDIYADPDGTDTERLVDACWQLGRPKEWRGLRRRADMLGFRGHFLTDSHPHKDTLPPLRGNRAAYVRATTSGPEPDNQTPEHETVLVVNFLEFVGAGWHDTGDAMLANASADLARSRCEATQHGNAQRRS